MRRFLINFSIFIGFAIVVSCSHTKYTGLKQYTTNFTTRYNTYFNIKQIYIRGYNTSVENAIEPTQNVLSVFPYEENVENFATNENFAGTTAKVSKLYAMKPNSKYMADALLYEAKIDYLKGKLDSAQFLLEDIVAEYPKGYLTSHFPTGKLKWYDDKVKKAKQLNEPISEPVLKHKFAKNEATLYLIKTYIKKNKADEAFALISNTESDMSFPLQYRKDLEKTKAMYNIQYKNYSEAISDLNKALEYKMTSPEKARMHFILGQLKELQNNNKEAYVEYATALKGKLKNNLRFEAKLRSIALSDKSPEDLISELKAMTRKGSFQNYLYKIYYTIANVYYKSGNRDKALEYFTLASSSAKDNNQKFFVFEQIAKFSYESSDYITSAKYYDSAVAVMPANYAKADEIKQKSSSLTKLLKYYKDFYYNDSLLNLVALGKEGATNQIEKMIKKSRDEHTANEEFANAQILNSSTNSSMGSWYYSDTIRVKQGEIAFKRKWGNLSLQDDWKFESNSSFSASSTSVPTNESSDLEPGTTMSAYDMARIEVERLPFDPGKKAEAITKVQVALQNMAKIYSFDIQDKKKAIETYQLLFKKYPDNIPNEDESLYSLFVLYAETGQLDKAQETKNILTSKYPNSKFSTYANNPNAKSAEEKENAYVENQYKKAFTLYKKADYGQSLSILIPLVEGYPKNPIIPKAKLLMAFIYSYTGDAEKQKTVLTHIVTNYPNTTEAITAQSFLDIINGATPSQSNPMTQTNPSQQVNSGQQGTVNSKEDLFKRNEVSTQDMLAPPTSTPTPMPKESKKEAQSNYSFSPYSPHYAMYFLTEPINPNSVKNLLTVYNSTNWDKEPLDVDVRIFGSYRIVLVGPFPNYEKATIYLNTAKNDPLLSNLIQKSEQYTISTTNMSILESSNNWTDYVVFFNKNY